MVLCVVFGWICSVTSMPRVSDPVLRIRTIGRSLCWCGLGCGVWFYFEWLVDGLVLCVVGRGVGLWVIGVWCRVEV